MKKKTSKPQADEQDYKLLWQHTLADFENYKRRTESDKKNWTNQAKSEFLIKILPLLDNLTLMADHTPEELKENAWVKGVEIISSQIESALLEEGITKIKPAQRDIFDPNLHEAISSLESDLPEGTIVKLQKPGYQIGDKIIRPAQVVVSKEK